MATEPGQATPVDSLAARLVRLCHDLENKPVRSFHRARETLNVSVTRNPGSIDTADPVETDVIRINIDHYVFQVPPADMQDLLDMPAMPVIFLEHKFRWCKQQVCTRDRNHPVDDILVCKYGPRLMDRITRTIVTTDQQLLRGIVQRTWGVVDRLRQEVAVGN